MRRDIAYPNPMLAVVTLSNPSAIAVIVYGGFIAIKTLLKNDADSKLIAHKSRSFNNQPSTPINL
jgi:hypothetical protein